MPHSIRKQHQSGSFPRLVPQLRSLEAAEPGSPPAPVSRTVPLPSWPARAARRTRGLALPAAFVLVCGLLGFGVHRLHLHQQARPAPAVVPAAPSEMLELPDGSSVEVEPSTQLRIDAAEPLRVRLTLLEGRSTLAVQSVEGRSFVVRAGHVDVNVLGGSISIGVKSRARDRWDVEVHATEGRADIHRGTGALPLVLEPGETWSSKAL